MHSVAFDCRVYLFFMHLSHRSVDSITSKHIPINTYNFTNRGLHVTLEISICDDEMSSRFTSTPIT
jgi:hypothetical protein